MNKLFRKPFSVFLLICLTLFILCALFAPFLASGKPIFVVYEGEWYFPLFRYLLYPGYYTKPLDRFFNLIILATPFIALAYWLFRRRKIAVTGSIILILFAVFAYLEWNPVTNPAWSSSGRNNDYHKLNELISYRIMKQHQARMELYLKPYHTLLEKWKGKEQPMNPSILPTAWNERQKIITRETERLKKENTPAAKKELQALENHEAWLEKGQNELRFLWMPFFRHYTWEEDVGGSQVLNEVVPWYELTRINRKDLTAALIFGTRISLVVGFVTVLIALAIGIPFGAIAGFYGGKFDILLSRVLEVWEAMPVLFMLLTVVAITQANSIFLIILVIGIFGWTGFARYVRAETLRVRRLAFVEASKTIGYGNMHILFSHILPNSLTAVLVLIPFAILAAISAEAGLSFLGLGEENSCSLGVLMDEGKTNFPAESYLLWPPAIVLSLLLIDIALLNDAIRDALDPRIE